MDFKQVNIDNVPESKSSIVSALPESSPIEEDDLPVYKVKFFIHQAHPIV